MTSHNSWEWFWECWRETLRFGNSHSLPLPAVTPLGDTCQLPLVRNQDFSLRKKSFFSQGSGESSSRKKWKIPHLNRSEIGTTNALQCQVQAWGDHIIGPRTAKNGNNYCTALKRNMEKSAIWELGAVRLSRAKWRTRKKCSLEIRFARRWRTAAASYPNRRTPGVHHKKGRPSAATSHESRPGQPSFCIFGLHHWGSTLDLR